MENKQINFFKAKDIHTVLKPFKKGTVVNIDSLELREKQKRIKIRFIWLVCNLSFKGASKKQNSLFLIV